MNPIRAKSLDELLVILKRIDISVSIRTEGRTTEQCEKWSICRFLASFAESEFIRFPVNITHRDKPDFLLQHSFGNVGIEVTEVVAENDAAIDAYREHQQIKGLFFSKHHNPGEPRLRGSVLVSKATSNESGVGWEGASVEREWGQAMQAFIYEKKQKTSKSGFQLFGKNWLLMYDNWSLPAVNQEVAAEMLFHSMQAEEFEPFERIFVECSKKIWAFSSTGFYSMPINELWDDN